jgi:hemolysin activation/secretion protein
MRQMSENIQLANENPAKQVEVTLGVSEEENKVNARVEVTEEDPQRYYVTLDNTGTTTSGRHRVGVSYQNANILNRDQTLTLNYITALDQPTGVKVDIFSAGYRIPIYALGDAIDIIYANSSTNTPANVLAPGGTLGINGKGAVYSLRYNHIMPRQGEYSSRLVAGFDYKFINATCTTAGAPVVFGTSASCTPYTVRPVSLTYSGNWQKPGKAIDFNVGLATNLPMGSRYTAGTTGFDRYSFVAGRPTNDRFTVLRLGGSFTTVLPKDYLFRAALTGQYARNALISGEQIGLAGSNAVRGFYERGVAADRGYFSNLEIYSPELAPEVGATGNLKALIFYDFASGQNLDVASTTTTMARISHISSFGAGLRYNLKKDISFKFDVASVWDGHRGDATGAFLRRDFLGHFSVAYGF